MSAERLLLLLGEDDLNISKEEAREVEGSSAEVGAGAFGSSSGQEVASRTAEA